MSKKRRCAAGLGLIAALALSACDDAPTITHVGATAKLDETRVVMGGSADYPVEIHGAPFPGLEPFQIAEVLTLPQGYRKVNFRAVEPGAHDYHTPIRLVLVFNGGVPDAAYHCKLKAPLETAPPTDVGFTVHAVYCSGENWFGQGFMKAPKVSGDDAEGFRKAMRSLFREILGQIDQRRD